MIWPSSDAKLLMLLFALLPRAGIHLGGLHMGLREELLVSIPNLAVWPGKLSAIAVSWDVLVSVNSPACDLMHKGDISVALNKRRHTQELAPHPEHILVDPTRRHLQSIFFFWQLFSISPRPAEGHCPHMPFRCPWIL